MSINCPKCKTSLPEHDELQYRFCPRCGAEITASKTETVENFLTIPPDLNDTVTQRRERTADQQIVEMHRATPINQTLEPVIAEKSTTRPEVVPPPGPPPTSFYRADSLHPTSGPENAQDMRIHRPRRLFKLLIIVIGAITILMGGILFLLLV
jgi:hypothetical protein